MAVSLPCVVIPYARFLACQDRRRRMTVQLTKRDRPRTVDANVVFVPPIPESPQTADRKKCSTSKSSPT
jgi:hypothetical protein